MVSSETEIETGIHQKRTLVFINHFIMKTVEFINNFAEQCEDNLSKFESKMQKVEASLIILESRLSSVPTLKEPAEQQKPEIKATEPPPKETGRPPDQDTTDTAKPVEEPVVETPSVDPAYEKYHKMMQFGVPAEAVKLKIIQDGLDPNMLR